MTAMLLPCYCHATALLPPSPILFLLCPHVPAKLPIIMPLEQTLQGEPLNPIPGSPLTLDPKPTPASP